MKERPPQDSVGGDWGTSPLAHLARALTLNSTSATLPTRGRRGRRRTPGGANSRFPKN
eukprot:CAMPEP_0180561720 /NCGR_PEP_ID=MMETSP1037_2-20121125/3531_1 /TAXON_ID=632150 /ORGANISM="Azadinium spinosum, Strain 3D9" /LENGTH=57 /DNA_ID=CAMNT_0022578379 /DNA_START=241 /DNA_END=411 /DNA_ORIENTATION=-